MHPISFHNFLKCAAVCQNEKITSSPPASVGMKIQEKTSPPTFVVEKPLHLHGRPGVSDTEHGARYNALLSRRAVCGPHQAPVRLVMESL